MNFKIALMASAMLVLGGAMTGCGNACDDAVDHIEECSPEFKGYNATDDCSGTVECQAECINDASCDEIKSGSESLAKCITGC